MLTQSSREDYRCLIEILTCQVCRELVEQAHICPNCSKFYCYGCISEQLRIEQSCLNCRQPLQPSMLVNCHQLCSELKQTLQMARLRGEASPRPEKSELYCGLHQLNKTYYCRTCHTPLCSDCSVLTQQHSGHEFVKLAIVRDNYSKRAGDLRQQLKNTKGVLLKRIEATQRGGVRAGSGGVESLADFEYANKAIREELKRKTNRILNQGQKDLDALTEVQDRWAQIYQESMKLIKESSKSKYVEKHHSSLEKQLTNILRDMPRLRKSMNEAKQRVLSHQQEDSFISPPMKTYNLMLEDFMAEREEEWFYTPTITTPEGLEWRLKVYPQGIKQSEQHSLKLTKKQSKTEEHLAIFIELVSGPTPSLQKHEIVVVNQLNRDRSVGREFESEFERGECWGYETFMRVSQLMEEGFYYQQRDCVEVILRLAPGNYHQACEDQLRLMELKQREVVQKGALLAKEECGVTTTESIECVGSAR